MESKNIHIFALAAHGLGISGTDRIFIEFARRWGKEVKVLIHVSDEGFRMCMRQNLKESKNLQFRVYDLSFFNKFGFVANYIARILVGIRAGLTLKLENSKNMIVYSASDFWMDSFPCFILKLRYPKIEWVAGWYQTAPLPWKGFSEGMREKKYYGSSFLYWLMQIVSNPLIKSRADLVLVNNEEEKRMFPIFNEEGRIMVVLGAVDSERIKSWRSKLGKQVKIYDAVFQGRFHPQKGVLELIDIWKAAVSKKPDAKLVMIGDGPLMENVKIKIQKSKLEENIILKGYLFDGEEKYKIFSQSKIVVHPAFYDSGGMAAAEAMAFGVPAVGFDLKSFKSYYPAGMIKVNIGNLQLFASSILDLINNIKRRTQLGEEALLIIEKSFSWDNRAREVLGKINSI